MKLIDKAALVAEIESKKKYAQHLGDNAINSSMRQFYDGMKQGCVDILSYLDTLEVKAEEEESVSKDLEAEFVLYLKHKFNIPQEGHKLKTNGWRPSPYDILDIAKHFAQWQKEQMEKNRIEHCDNITEEQYNLETGFIDEHLKKYNRIPTILDAIEYGMKKAQKDERNT